MSLTKSLTASTLSRISSEDLCSQVNYIWTAMTVATMGLMVSLVQYVGDPIHCWCPAELPEAQCNYTKALCWIKQNYYIHEDKEVPFKEDNRYDMTVAYYPWVPWILFFMGAMLNLPNIVWHAFLADSGLNLSKFISLADTHEDMSNLAKILRIWLVRTKKPKDMFSGMKRTLGSVGMFGLGKHQRSYLAGLLLLVKLSYFVVTFGLFLSMNLFLDQNFFWYGWDVIDHFLKGTPPPPSRFPKQTLCDIKVRQMANIQTYSIQCILPINMFNEKIFMFLWYWFVVLNIMNACSFAKWAFYLLSPGKRRQFVKQYVIILYHLLQKREEAADGSSSSSASSRTDQNDNAIPEDGAPDSAGGPGPPEPPTGTSLRSRTGGNLTWSDSITTLSSAGGGGGGGGSGPPERHSRHPLRPSAPPPPPPLPPPLPPSSIEDPKEREKNYLKAKKEIRRITAKMMKHFGHDGVVVFRILENAVGIVIANNIFQELYEQMEMSMHYS